jgi:hypothetical protein
LLGADRDALEKVGWRHARGLGRPQDTPALLAGTS